MPVTLADSQSGSRFPDAEWQARIELAACYRLADLFGFSDIIWNHITAKVPGAEHFLINRFGLRYDEVTASNLVTLDLDGNVVNPGSGVSEEDVNLTGYVIHSAVHRAREDVRCVMHCHAEAGLAVSVLKDGLVPMILDAMPFYDRVSYHEFEGQSDDTDECERLAASLGDRFVMILRNHGLLTCGESVGAAFMRMYYLERACKVQLQVMATGQALELPSEELCKKSAEQLTRFPPGEFEWPALLRLAEAKFPDFRQ
ncbi:MAG: class II aldolase/adducin family protein [Gammaproteobacteria bacterium]|nr:class II aldolase/adducin family protein [Gammaproteobacteria bacterium]